MYCIQSRKLKGDLGLSLTTGCNTLGVAAALTVLRGERVTILSDLVRSAQIIAAFLQVKHHQFPSTQVSR